MDRKRKKKLQNIRIIMTNVFMGVSVITIVFVLMLIAMGYRFTVDGGLEQSGLVQIKSNPKGAVVDIDGETQFSHTDFSKMLSSGNHQVKISKDGYDTWEKTINVEAGLLTRIEWARLFPLQANYSDTTTFSSIRLAEYSTDHKHLFVIEHNSTVAQYLNLQGEKVHTNKIPLGEAFSSNNQDILEGAINVVAWNETGNKLLATWTNKNTTTWHLIDLENANKSVNLNKTFNIHLADVHIANDSASKLWVLENGNIHIIDMSNETISSVLITGVEQFTNNKDVIGYVGLDNEDNNYRKISIFKEGENGSTTIHNLKNKKPTITLAMGTCWNKSWLAYSVDDNITVVGGTYPSFDKPSKNSLKEMVQRKLEYTPNLATTNQLGRIVAFTGSSNLTSIDIETRNYYDTTTEADITELSWLDDYLIWENNNNTIVIRDFDGDNRREILEVNNQYPINITDNNRWLYFFEQKEAEIDQNGETQNTTNDSSGSQTFYVLKRQKLE